MASFTSQCVGNFPSTVNLTSCEIYGACKVANATYSTCSCIPGRAGTSCEGLKQPLQWVYIFDGVFYFFTFFLWIFLAIRRYRQTKGADFEAAMLKGVLTSRPQTFGPRTLLFYRFCAFGFTMGVHGDSLDSAPGTYIFYTTWNFIIVVTYFGLGLGISAFTFWKGNDALLRSPYMRFNAILHYVLLEIELTNTLIVDVIVWAILLPSCAVPCTSLINFSSFVQHLINFPLMLTDFLLSRHAIDRRHYFYILAMPTSYAIFHLFWTMSRDATLGHIPVYFFMDASVPIQPAWVFGVLLIHIGMFYLVWAFSTFVLKRKLDADFSEGIDTKALMSQVDTHNPAFQDPKEQPLV